MAQALLLLIIPKGQAKYLPVFGSDDSRNKENDEQGQRKMMNKYVEGTVRHFAQASPAP